MNEVYGLGFSPAVWHWLISLLFLMVILVPAAIGDYQHQKIPNWLSMSGWLVGPLIGAVFSGISGFGDALLGLTFMLGIMFPLWMIHWFGAADVKLLASVGAVAGFDMAPTILLGVVLTGLLVSLVILIYQRRLGLLIFELFSGELFKSLKSAGERKPGDNTQRLVLPYAIPIAFGTMLAILYMQVSR